MFTLVSTSVDQLEWAVETNADIIFMGDPASVQKIESIDSSVIVAVLLSEGFQSDIFSLLSLSD